MKKRDIAATVLASLAGIGIATAASAIVAYRKIFPRYNRPNYALKPGEYYYPLVEPRLPRTKFRYPSGINMLSGYHYPSRERKGLVVVCHGMHAGADDYLPLIEFVVRAGYDVFSYDCTGTYESEGEDTVGMCQQLIDLEQALRFIRTLDHFRGMRLFLIGHSWGAYACASVLSLFDGVSACACIAGMNSGPSMIVEKAQEYVGGLAHLPEPAFAAYQRMLFGDYVDCTAVRGINSSNIPILLAHGVEDKVIRFDTTAIIAHAAEIHNPQVRYYIGKGLCGGHDSIWHSQASIGYQMEIESEMKLRQLRLGRLLTDEEKARFYRTVNHRLYSAPNETLAEIIIDTFDRA